MPTSMCWRLATRIVTTGRNGATRLTAIWKSRRRWVADCYEVAVSGPTGIEFRHIPVGRRERWLMRVLMVALSSLALLSPAWCDEGHHHSLTEEEVGSVHFVTSCSKTVGVSFNRAVALLHSFQYEQTRQA